MLIGFLTVISILNFLLLLLVLIALNDGFDFTNKNINSRNKLLEVLVNQFDNVVTKYKMMVKSINADK